MPRLPKKAADQVRAALPQMTREQSDLDAQLKEFIQKRIGEELPEILESLFEQAKGIWVEQQRPDGTVGKVYQKEPFFPAAQLLLQYKAPVPKAVQQMEVAKTVTYEEKLEKIAARKVGGQKALPIIVVEPQQPVETRPLISEQNQDYLKSDFRARFGRA